MARTKRTNGQKFFIGLIGAAFALLLIGSRDELRKTYDVLLGIDRRYLFILPALQLLSYFCTAKYYQAMLELFGRKIKTLKIYPMIISLYFVEQALPSGGASGVTYISYILRDYAKTGVVTLIQTGRYVVSFTAYLAVIVVALMLVVNDGGATGKPTQALILGIPIFLAISGFSLIAWRVFTNQSHMNGFAHWLSARINDVGRLLHGLKLRSSTDEIVTEKQTLSEMKHFHGGIEQIVAKRVAAIKPMSYMIAGAILQVVIVYLAFIALGESVNPGYVVIAFTAANFVGVISVIPGDVGVHEGAIIAALSFMGVETSVAISATLLYRVYNKMFVLLIGFTLYSRFIRPSEKPAE